MELLPNDMVVYIALSMDIPEVLSLCQTSKRINQIVCDNNNFWISKLKRDYDITMEDPSTTKSAYKNITNVIKKVPNPDDLLEKAIKIGSIMYVKIALDSGANIHKPMLPKHYPIVAALRLGHENIAQYLLTRGAVSYDISALIPLMRADRRKDINKFLYDYIVPASHQYVDDPEVYQMLAEDLEFEKNNDPYRYTALYERHIDELRSKS